MSDEEDLHDEQSEGTGEGAATEPERIEAVVEPKDRDEPAPEKKRGCLVGPLTWFFFMPVRAHKSLVRDRSMGFFGLLLFLLILLLYLYVYASPFVWYASYSFPAKSRGTATTHTEQVEGVAYVDALLYCYDTGMTHWMVNDRVAPTIFLDNPQNFQYGVLEGVRYGTRILRDNLSRQRSTDEIDADIDEAFQKFSFDADSWILPTTEAKYREGANALRRYRERLISGEARFQPRADNLAELLQQFNSLTGGANVRLLNCIPDPEDRISEETLGDPTQGGESLIDTKVPWSETDDQFYFARGVAFVYREIMVAVNSDFREILEQRNAQELSIGIVRDFLNKAQFEPVYVANGRFGSLWANHPYQLLGLLSQVRERSRSLHTMVAIDVR